MLIGQEYGPKTQELYDYVEPLVITQNSGYKEPLWIKDFITYRLEICINTVIAKRNKKIERQNIINKKQNKKIKKKWNYNIRYYVDTEDLIGYLIYQSVKAERKYQDNVENKHIYVLKEYLTTFMEKSIEKYILNFVIRKNTHRKKDSPKIKYIYQCNNDDINEYYSFRKYRNQSNRCDFDFDYTGLSNIQKKVIELKYYRNLSTQKIAEKIGVSSDNVRQIHYRAIQVLRKDNKQLECYYNRLIRKVA
jgi:RNA polymerase sigma factor (sigma-70 family)